jgi:hypothetical protein
MFLAMSSIFKSVAPVEPMAIPLFLLIDHVDQHRPQRWATQSKGRKAAKRNIPDPQNILAQCKSQSQSPQMLAC